MTLSWPLATLGPSLPNLVATVAGNLFELAAVSGLRLLDIRMPPAFAEAYPGPGFGIEGTRRLAGVQGRPMIGTIIKPSVGLDAEATAALVEELCEAGIDFIKDDELQADGPHCPFDERVRAVMRVIEAQADRTGRKAMYAFNLTGDLDEMRRRHDTLLAHGATCLMASLNSVGLVGMVELRRFSQLPIHAHRNGWGYLSRHPLLGWSYVAWQKLWRLAGADHMHVNGLDNKFSEPDESVIDSARACLAPMFDGKPCTVMPVFSSGQTVRQAHPTYAALRSTDLIMTAGGGIVAHPGGPAAGVRSMREAWEAAVAGIPLDEHAREPSRARPCPGDPRMIRPRALPDGPLVAFYGDDFTGSSASMEALAFAGLDTVLFLAPPTPERLAAFAGFRGIGIAGVARSRDPAWMDEHLPPVFRLLQSLGRRSSTTRSARPSIPPRMSAPSAARSTSGGAVRGLDAARGRRAADGPLPVLRQPLRARPGEGYRLDRHPTMSRHPVTPMDEADLGRHLARQTGKPIGLMDFVAMKRGHGEARLDQRSPKAAGSCRSTCSTRRP